MLDARHLVSVLSIAVGTAYSQNTVYDAKEVFGRTNARFQERLYNNIAIEFKWSYNVRDHEDPDKLQEIRRDITLFKKGQQFRKLEAYTSSSGASRKWYRSYNAMSVSFMDVLEIPEGPFQVVYISDHSIEDGLDNLFYVMFHLRREPGISTLFKEYYFKDGDVLVARSKDDKYREEIHFTDIENCLFSKIDTYKEQILIDTYSVDEWVKLGPTYLPKVSHCIRGGRTLETFELRDIVFEPDFSQETFIARIPYRDDLFVHNQDVGENIRLSRCDRTLWEKGDYTGAFYDAYTKAMDAIVLDAVAGVEDVTSQVVVAAPDHVRATGQLSPTPDADSAGQVDVNPERKETSGTRPRILLIALPSLAMFVLGGIVVCFLASSRRRRGAGPSAK